MRAQEFTTEGLGGLAYEQNVYAAMQAAKIKGLDLGDKPTAGFSNVGYGDIEATYNGKPFNIEIKASANDQMGGTSFRYEMAGQKFIPVGQIEPDELDMLLQAAQVKAGDIDKFLKAAQKYENNTNITGFPVRVDKETREKLKADGLQKAIASNISASSSFIIRHYNKKKVYYIQVGGAGLFYMGKNPLNLPVPELQGDINIELRVGYGGSGGKPTVSAGIRLQGRMKTENVSNFTLDDPGSIQALFMQ